MDKWVTLLKSLPQERSQLTPFLATGKNFQEFMALEYWSLPEELRREVERNLATRKGAKFLDLLQLHPNHVVKTWAITIAELLPAELRIPRLLKALGDRDEGIKLIATSGLGKLKSTEVVKLLIEGLSNDQWVPARIAQTLSNMQEFALPQVIELLAHPEERIRLYAVEILEQTELASAGEALQSSLQDISPMVRKKSAAALLSFGGIFPGPALTDALRGESDPQTRLQLIRVLGKMKFGLARETILAQLHDADLKVVQAAKVALDSLEETQQNLEGLENGDV